MVAMISPARAALFAQCQKDVDEFMSRFDGSHDYKHIEVGAKILKDIRQSIDTYDASRGFSKQLLSSLSA